MKATMWVKVGLLALVLTGACGSKQQKPSAEDGAGPKPPAGECVKSGCSGTLCVEPGKEVVTTCEWKQEYACYQDAACERQADGACAFTQTDALESCLAKAPAAGPSVQ
jgi:hypothetical protein